LQVVQLHTQRGLDVVVVDLAVGQEKTLDSEIKYVSQTVGGWTTGKVSSAVTSYLEVHYGMVDAFGNLIWPHRGRLIWPHLRHKCLFPPAC